MVEYHNQSYYVLLLTINVTVTLIVMLAACLCCKRKAPKNELLGLEGMVKLKNPDEVVVVTTVRNSESQADLNLSTVSNADSEKRASTAVHRSLPDIPVAETNGDNGSELYETVADKRLLEAQNNEDKSPIASLKKQTSVSQHSSISQADDISSPYSRVKNSPHNYAKVRSTEHPYAQLNVPSTSGVVVVPGASGSQNALNHDTVNRSSHHSNTSQQLNEVAPQAEIAAASAIAGMISASQDLPYMTPPITNQHFSGDSQDSSKGYTSISVREPLANILAQQPPKPLLRNARDVNDSHYATVSDDSDETYAAIEDPNIRLGLNTAADIYTSGSETYAQIQPMHSNSIVVAVEINNSSAVTIPLAPASNPVPLPNLNTSNVINAAPHHHILSHSRPTSEHVTPIPPPVDSLRAAQMHSRQASSSSNNSSMGNLGSPKPEKRQANSPLPPTPKSNSLHTAGGSNLTSGRNSVISVIELGSVGNPDVSETGVRAVADSSPQKKDKSLSPTKDIEGMYAKVMKKNKFSRNSPPSQSNSPVLTRKFNDHAAALGISPLDSAAAELMDAHKISVSDKNRIRSNSYNAKDHGYETIPADAMRSAAGVENRKSDCYANILQKERQQEGAHLLNPTVNYTTKAKPPNDSDTQLDKHYETIAGPLVLQQSNDPGYEELLKSRNQSDPELEKKTSDYDPNYEVLKSPQYTAIASASAGLSDDGYAKVIEKKPITIDEDSIDGYSKVKGEYAEDGAIGGYSTIGEVKGAIMGVAADANHNYASILEAKAELSEANETDSDHYARIAESRLPATPDLLSLSAVSTPARTSDGTLTPLPITSPTSLNSSSLLNNSSTTSSTSVTTSNSTLSSTRQTPSSCSQYESLTGSDTDPNYESVCYLTNTSRENPYERLQTDYSDTQLSSSPLTPEERSAATAAATPTSVAKMNANGPKPQAKQLSTDVVVDDYFQV